MFGSVKLDLQIKNNNTHLHPEDESQNKTNQFANCPEI